MNTYLVEGQLGLPQGELGRIEHDGYLNIEAGALVFRDDPFGFPYIGYAPGQWLRFELKED